VKGLDGGRPVWARVDLARLSANYRALVAYARRPLLPILKADAYGHGAAAVARRLAAEGVERVAVALVEEGLALRQEGVALPVVVLGTMTAAQVEAAAQHGLIPVISTPAGLAAARQAARAGGRPWVVHLKVDTGMTRLGFPPDQAVEAAGLLRKDGLELEGFMTHLASADESTQVTARQLDAFDAVLGRLHAFGIRPPLVHAANSAGMAQLRPTHTLARPGLLLYGLRPRPLSPPVDVQPVMTVSGRITLVREVPAGTAVSYGGRYVVHHPSRIGTIPLGYADGVPRTAAMSSDGWWGVRGQQVPVAGAVSMDFTAVDLTDFPQLAEGDEAVLFGDSPTAWDVADCAGTHAWQVLTAVGPRVPRLYVDLPRP
jgi:alanine racemase